MLEEYENKINSQEDHSDAIEEFNNKYELKTTNSFSTNTIVPPKSNDGSNKQSGGTAFAATLAAICMIGSAAFGFGGTYLANRLNPPSVPVVSNSTDETNAITDAEEEIDSVHTSTQQPKVDAKTTSIVSREKLSVEEIVANTKSCVVEITTEMISTGGIMRQYISTGAGSGVILTDDGYIVTNNHVISGAQTIKVRLEDKSEYDATLIGTDPRTDIAVIKIEADNLSFATPGNSNDLIVGETAVAIGNPLGELGGTVTTGIISALDREIIVDGETMSLLQTDASINPGNSGGGLFNLYGELIGVVNAKSSGSDVEGLGFAIPINTASEITEQLITYGYVRGRVDAGLELVDINDFQTAMYYRVSELGLYVSDTKGDFQSGDIITSVNGEDVYNLTEFNKAINEYKINDTVEIEVKRSGRVLKIPLVLGELTT